MYKRQVNAPWTYFANMNAKQGTEKWGVIWPAATMAKRIGALGVDGKKTVIAYCDACLLYTSRCV